MLLQAPKGGKKGKARTKQQVANKRASAAAAAANTDEQLMKQMGETIGQMREDFIVVHFRPSCSFCRKYHGAAPTGGPAWFCPEVLPGHAPQAANTQQAKRERDVFSLCNEVRRCWIRRRLPAGPCR